MKCPKCRSEQKSKSRYCTICGFDLGTNRRKEYCIVIGVSIFIILVGSLGIYKVKRKEYLFYNKLLKQIKYAMDIQNPETRNFSVQIAAKYPGNLNVDQICSIYDFLYKNWKYVNDPRATEFFSPASNTIKANLTGDCDDFAILMASMIEAIGGTTRITLASNKIDRTGHAFAEVFVGYDSQKIYDAINDHYRGFWYTLLGIRQVDQIHYRKDEKNRVWLNLDWTNKYPGGKYFTSTREIIFYPKEDHYKIYRKS